ncbi:hypothetical protein A9G36_03000 [Gilliamella sp. Choc6-1]|jgi:TolA-binding protein|uniref:tail fiber assembly protein n=1 Tax=unclassified Gilliamella TaxID=2685620 RepID=UPI00080ED137|nr:tail fiber assembly protein [Gilliamella apicola]OCG31480.1 hypothetical protein A9G33_00110 [Gilliamella apicola]OCG56313.1 hypothetical protein A9G36_03000 [Gilliamella apicola]
MTIYYNSKKNAFYDSDINAVPLGSIEISAELHAKLLQNQTNGLVITSDKRGQPIAIEPIITSDDKKELNSTKKQKLINEANEKIAILQDIIDLDMQEANEEEQLKQWKKYRILLMRVDINQSDINWPEQPRNI